MIGAAHLPIQGHAVGIPLVEHLPHAIHAIHVLQVVAGGERFTLNSHTADRHLARDDVVDIEDHFGLHTADLLLFTKAVGVAGANGQCFSHIALG